MSSLQYSLSCVVDPETEKLHLTLQEKERELSHWVIDTREKLIREGLIKLG